MISRTVRARTFPVSVKVPGRGQLTISGRGIRTAHTTVARAGRYSIRVRITRAAGRTLAKRHKLRLRLQVRYTPPAARAQVAMLALALVPRRSRLNPQPRADSIRRGGAR
jgi:hypothetical protein